MKVRLIAKTSGYEGTEYEGKSIDEIIVGIARISSSRETNDLFKEPEKLLRHCLLNGHWSVFGMANLTFEIITSRAIGRELLRHLSQIKVQEISQRYVTVFDQEPLELRLQAVKNRQSSTDVVEDISIIQIAEDSINHSNVAYKKLLDAGVARESARMVLPELTQTKLIMNGPVREWITTLNQRLHKTAQKECRWVAEAIKEIFIRQCPIIASSLYNFDNAYEIHILDRLVLEKYKVYDKIGK